MTNINRQRIDIITEGKQNIIMGELTTTLEEVEKQKAEYSVKYGDILFNRTSEVPDEIAFSSVYLDETEITFGGFVIRGRQKKELLDPLFAGYCFNNSSIRREMIRRSQGVVRANIGQKDLNKVPFLNSKQDQTDHNHDHTADHNNNQEMDHNNLYRYNYKYLLVVYSHQRTENLMILG